MNWSHGFKALERTGWRDFVFEPVVGAAGGVVPAPPGYAAAVRAVCDRHDVLLIADEVMKRRGAVPAPGAPSSKMASCPTSMTVAKGLAGGYIRWRDQSFATVGAPDVGHDAILLEGAPGCRTAPRRSSLHRRSSSTS